MAIKFNETYGQTFVIPEPQIREEVAVVPGIDGQKMSKSYGNTIEIFGDEKATRKKDHEHHHGQPHAAGAQAGCGEKPRAAIAQAGCAGRCREGSRRSFARRRIGYGDLKKALFEHYWNYFAASRAKRAELAANLPYVRQVLREGAEKARRLAQTVLQRRKKTAVWMMLCSP